MVKIYRIGIFLNALSFAFLFFLKNEIVNYIYLYAIVTSFIQMLYWQPYKNMIYNFNGDDNYKKFNAYTNIVGNIISIISTISMGYIISRLSYKVMFVIIFVISFIAFLITYLFDTIEYSLKKFDNKNIKKILSDKKSKSIFKIVFYEGMGNSGSLSTAIQLVIFLNLGSEFSLGYWNALFSTLGVITAILVKNYLKKEKYSISFYISSISIIISLIPLIFSKSFIYFIIYNIVFNIAYQVTSILMNSVVFNVKNTQILDEYKLEYTFIQESTHAFGKIFGEFIILFVVTYMFSLQNLQIVVCVLSITIFLQAIEYKKILRNSI